MRLTRTLVVTLAMFAGVISGCGSSSCTAGYTCVNGACTCSEGSMKDSSCCDPKSTTCTTNTCDRYCSKVCT